MNPLELMAYVACAGLGLIPAAVVINLTVNNIIACAAAVKARHQ